MMTKAHRACVFLFAVLATTSAVAHDPASTYDRVNFRVSATQEVDNDILVAVMYHERSGQHPTAMADEVNRTITWAVDLAKKSSAIKVQTLNYRQEALYKNQTVTGWKVRQSIRLESTDAAALSTLIGELQNRLSVASIRYTLSPDVRARIEDVLIAKALARFKRRGELISLELGRQDYRIVNLDVATSGRVPAPVRMRAVAAMAESPGVAPPTFEAGVQSVTVQVSGSIELEAGR
jgi:predicted secreted protein